MALLIFAYTFRSWDKSVKFPMGVILMHEDLYELIMRCIPYQYCLVQFQNGPVFYVVANRLKARTT